MRVQKHLIVLEREPIPEATRLALNLRAGMADLHPLPEGDCDLCGRGPRILAWTKDSLRLCVECATDQCIECGGKEGWHFASCSEMAIIDLRVVEGSL